MVLQPLEALQGGRGCPCSFVEAIGAEMLWLEAVRGDRAHTQPVLVRLGSSAPCHSRMGVSASQMRFLLIERLPSTMSCIHNGMLSEKHPLIGVFPLPAELPCVFDVLLSSFLPRSSCILGMGEVIFLV